MASARPGVAYSGASGDSIRAVMKAVVCETLGGSLVGSRCVDSAEAAAARFAFVTESLGSKMLFDAVRDIWKERSLAGQRVAQ